MEHSLYENCDLYQKDFKPEAHIAFKRHLIQNEESAEGKVVKMMHQALNTGTIQGKDYLDVGCGPTVHFNIIPSQYFENIYLADYLERNVDIIKTWLNNEPGQTDYQPFFDYAGKWLGKGSTWPEGPSEFSKKIRGVFQCDIHQPQVLPPGVQPRTFDCVASSFVLTAACTSEAAFDDAVLHLASLVKPGGTLFSCIACECSFFHLEDVILPNFSTTDETLKVALDKAGLQILQTQRFYSDFMPNCDTKYVAVYIAKKI